jgi:hypothetical protein
MKLQQKELENHNNCFTEVYTGMNNNEEDNSFVKDDFVTCRGDPNEFYDFMTPDIEGGMPPLMFSNSLNIEDLI